MGLHGVVVVSRDGGRQKRDVGVVGVDKFNTDATEIVVAGGGGGDGVLPLDGTLQLHKLRAHLGHREGQGWKGLERTQMSIVIAIAIEIEIGG